MMPTLLSITHHLSVQHPDGPTDVSFSLQIRETREKNPSIPPTRPSPTLLGPGTMHKILLVTEVRVASYPVGQPGVSGWPWVVHFSWTTGIHVFFFPPLCCSVPIPSSTHFLCLSIELLVTTRGTQGSHLAPMVVLRAKDISDCGVSIIDNKAPRTLITLLPYVLRAHNQVRRGRM